MQENDLAWDYSVYALNSITLNLCVIASIGAGCVCFVFLKRHPTVKWCVLALVAAVTSSACLVAIRSPGFETYVTRDLLTMFAFGYAGGVVADLIRQKRARKNGGSQ